MVFKDSQGRIVYPGLIPPDVETPGTHARTPSAAKPDHTTPAEYPESSSSSVVKTQSQPPPTTSSSSKPLKKGRPAMDRKFLTDSLHHTERRRSTLPSLPVLRRAGTHVHALDRALESHYSGHGGDEASDFSSDEEEGHGSQQPRQTEESSEQAKKRDSEDKYRRFRVANQHFHTKGRVSRRDGRLNINITDLSNTGYLAKALGSAVKKMVVGRGDEGKSSERQTLTRFSSASTTYEGLKGPKLNIVIMVIGSRGDIQPFLKIGKLLKEEHGHRVRMATHPAFRDFVEKDTGLEFFSVGGDPSELMAFMVKNPGLIPKLETVRSGDIGRRRAAMAEMFGGFWRACINVTDNEKDTRNLRMMGDRDPFIADAIIANPPSFAHVHCAEALGIPLHLMFTFPYTPTQAFPHPLATVRKSNVDPGYSNFISYPLVEMMVWQGLGDLVNDFRTKTLGLDPVSTLWAPGSTYRLHVPFTYLWSPGLCPKPPDWGPEIDVAGFVFLNLASSFQPPQGLVDFLEAGETPIYIGFGSIVVDDADRFTEMIFEAVRKAGVRALVSKGWGGIGHGTVPDNIFLLDNTPHDWLFPRVRACVIHGGAGTTAIALKCGRPTMIVPFFGDQHFWGPMVAKAGAGPDPVPYRQLSADRLAEGIKYCLTDRAAEAAQEIARSIEEEGDGAQNAVRSFHSHLPLSGENSIRCSILHDRVAAWHVKGTSLKLSALAADIAVDKGFFSWRGLRLIRHREWNDFEGPGEPFTGVTGTLVGTAGNVFTGIGSVPYRLAKTSRKRTEKIKRKEERRKRKQQQSASAGFPFPDHGEASSRIPAQNDGAGDEIARNNTNNSTALTPGTATPGTAPLEPATEQYFHEIQEGVGQSGKALARAPVDLSVAVAQGFHNAPRLYGDHTVRRPIRVTGIKSGLRAARAEFLYGIYDGVTGLVRLPVRGAKEQGLKGALAGVGMGLIGFVLKDLSALIGPVGFTLQGIAKQLAGGKPHVKYIRRARIIQAQRELQALKDPERKALIEQIRKGCDVMHELAELIMEEKGKHGIQSRFPFCGGRKNQKSRTLGKYGRGSAFESVEMAESAIRAIKRGESMDVVLCMGRKSLVLGKGNSDRRSNHQIPHRPNIHRQSGETQAASNTEVNSVDNDGEAAVSDEEEEEEGGSGAASPAGKTAENGQSRDNRTAAEAQ
ncbi:glycosyltransferase family 1 protein [Xylariomycetidae sp. FL0641]|nr:glycosyltransferase family 1 protein [Xylariomycetidae sp. FL0641]